MKTLKQKGFTLIELLIVIVVLGILSVAIAPKFLDFSEDAKDATAEGVVGALQSAVMMGQAKIAMGVILRLHRQMATQAATAAGIGCVTSFRGTLTGEEKASGYIHFRSRCYLCSRYL